MIRFVRADAGALPDFFGFPAFPDPDLPGFFDAALPATFDAALPALRDDERLDFFIDVLLFV